MHEIKYERIDRRRNKEYKGVLTAVLHLDPGKDYSRGLTSMGMAPLRAFHKAIKDRSLPKEGFDTLSVDSWYHYGSSTGFWLTARKICDADRPSEILSKEDILSQVDVKALERHANKMLWDAVEAAEKDMEEQQAREHADHLLGVFLERLRKKAREVTRYNQRLAALRAEAEAEYLAQIPNVSGEFQKALFDYDGCTDRAKSLVLEHMEDYAKSRDAGLRSKGFIPSRESPYIQTKLSENE